MGDYTIVHDINKVDGETINLPLLLAVLEPAMIAYKIAGFNFKIEYGRSTVRFYIEPDSKIYDMNSLSKFGIPLFTFVVSLRQEIGTRPENENIFDVGYNRCAAITSEYTHRGRCDSYERIPELFSKAIELWKAGE